MNFWTDVEFWINPKMEKDTVYLGKHQLRFKTKLVKDFNLKHGDLLRIGVDKNENPKKHLYIVRCEDEQIGFKFCESKNHTYSIAFKGLYKWLDILNPTNARYTIEMEPNKTYYIKVYLPKFE